MSKKLTIINNSVGNTQQPGPPKQGMEMHPVCDDGKELCITGAANRTPISNCCSLFLLVHA